MGWFTKKPDDPRNAEYKTLTPDQKRRVDGVIKKQRQTGAIVREPYGWRGDVYSYPEPDGDAWGIDDPHNIKRGVKPR